MNTSPSVPVFRKRLAGLLAIFLILGGAGALAGAAFPQSAGGDLKDRVSAVLVKFPAESGTDRDTAAAELLALGGKGILEACRRLTAAGADDDSVVRFALHGVAVYAARSGAEHDRALLAGALAKGLDIHADAGIKAFLLSQLQLVGRADVVGAIAARLKEPDLADPAARALASIGGVPAERALLAALNEASARAQVPAALALGKLRSRQAVQALLAAVRGADASLRAAALWSLAEIGDPAARPALELVSAVLSDRERSAAALRFLRFAERLVENGFREPGLDVARRVLDGFTNAAENQVRAAALDLLGRTLGNEIVPDLLRAAESGDPVFRRKALTLAETLPSIEVETWLEKAASLPAENKADVIALLGRRGEREALPYIRENLRSGDPSVRLASIESYSLLRGVDAAEELFPFFASADEDQVETMKMIVLGWPSSVAVPLLAAGTGGFPAAAQKAALEIFAERQAAEGAPVALSLAASEDESVKAAALAALEPTADPGLLPALIDLLGRASQAKEVVPLQNAVVAAARRISDSESRADAVVDALKKAESSNRVNLLRILPKIGGAEALRAAAADADSQDAAVRAAALFALSNWPDAAALDELFQLAGSEEKRTRYIALQGIARLIGGASAPDRLARWNQALALAVQDDEKNVLMGGLGGIREAAAAKLAADFLAQPAFQARAAAAIARIVLPDTGIEGLSGCDSALALKSAIPYLDDAYDREQAEAYARTLLLKEGYASAFNGRDLSGWKGLVEDPPKRAAMTPEELARAQAAADDLMRQHWRILEGALVFDGQGHSLCTAKDYGDFEMFVDWKIEPQGDSGIYLRGSPQVQIWDPVQGPEGSGGLYNNLTHPSKPLAKADRPVGEWNTFYIRMAGDRVTVRLNGVLVVGDTVMENYWERDKPIYPRGQIELQAHSTPLAFKNIFIRELPPGPGAAFTELLLTPEERAEGFVPLFNGRNLDGWRGDTGGYIVENAAIVALPEGSGNLYTEKEYADFILRFEFKLTPGANNGIGIRAPLNGDAAYAGMEIQVLDDPAEAYKDLQPYQYHGSIYGVAPSRRGFLKPAGEWNAEEIIARGRRIMVILNGTVIIDADLDAASAGGTIDHRDHPGLRNAAGHIGFLGHGSRVEFRNLRIKEISTGGKRP